MAKGKHACLATAAGMSERKRPAADQPTPPDTPIPAPPALSPVYARRALLRLVGQLSDADAVALWTLLVSWSAAPSPPSPPPPPCP
jgi:hypothetical protein